MMTGCIVGWAHSKFGKHDGRDVESLIVEVAEGALADASVAAADIDSVYLGTMAAQPQKDISCKTAGPTISRIGRCRPAKPSRYGPSILPRRRSRSSCGRASLRCPLRGAYGAC